jgi:hypothetical protein
MTQSNQEPENNQLPEATAFVAGGTAAGAGVSAAVGGMGLVGGFGGVAIGMAPVAAAGAVVGSAAYGAKKALEEGDATALGAIAAGAAGGAGVSAVVGGMGLAVGGTAVAVGMAPVAVAGAVVGLGAYGLSRLIDQAKTINNSEQGIESLQQIKLNIQQEIVNLNASSKVIQQQYQQAQHEVKIWGKVAEAAMKQEREDLARKALERKLAHQQNVITLKNQLEQVKAKIKSLKEELLIIEKSMAEG